MNDTQVHELLFQALETELGGVQIYETALDCVENDDLREEWQKYHEQTTRHVAIVRDAGGEPVTRRAGIRAGQLLEAEFADGRAPLRAEGD